MAANAEIQGMLQQLRRGRRLPAVLLALCAYFLAGAAVPPGHMAAPIGSGTPFHLCPGDLRSAQILDALAAAAPAKSHHAHHHGGHHPPQHGAGDTVAVADKSSADPGCSFAGGGLAVLASAPEGALSPEAADAALPAPPVSLSRRGAWLQPPARSPPPSQP
jgi:hypothetical protein